MQIDKVIGLQGLDGGLRGVARGHRRGQDQHVLAFDHGLDVVAEDQLAARGVLRGHHVDGLVRVHVAEVVARQLLGKARADDLHAVQTQHGVDDGGVRIGCHQRLCHSLRLGQARLLHGDVDVVVDVAVAGGKVPLCHAQKEIGSFGG